MNQVWHLHYYVDRATFLSTIQDSCLRIAATTDELKQEIEQAITDGATAVEVELFQSKVPVRKTETEPEPEPEPEAQAEPINQGLPEDAKIPWTYLNDEEPF